MPCHACQPQSRAARAAVPRLWLMGAAHSGRARARCAMPRRCAASGRVTTRDVQRCRALSPTAASGADPCGPPVCLRLQVEQRKQLRQARQQELASRDSAGGADAEFDDPYYSEARRRWCCNMLHRVTRPAPLRDAQPSAANCPLRTAPAGGAACVASYCAEWPSAQTNAIADCAAVLGLARRGEARRARSRPCYGAGEDCEEAAQRGEGGSVQP